MNYRDLEAVRQIVDKATGLEISYAYDDLVFPDHTAFIIQFDEADNNSLFCYFQKDCSPTESKNIFSNLANESAKVNCSLVDKGTFHLEQEEENVKIIFNEESKVL